MYEPSMTEERPAMPVASAPAAETAARHGQTATAAPMTAHTVATMTTVATSRSGGDSGSGQSERGDSCERDFAKHGRSLRLFGVSA